MGDLNRHLIGTARQEELRNEYLETNYAFINANRPMEEPDSLDYSFDLDVLQDYLNYVKEKAGELGITNIKIKVEMGKYPNNSTDSKLNPAYKGYQTIYFVAADGNSSPYPGECENISQIEGLNFSSICPPYGVV